MIIITENKTKLKETYRHSPYLEAIFERLLKKHKRVNIKFEKTTLNSEAVIQARKNYGIDFLFPQGSQGEGLRITIDYDAANITIFENGRTVDFATIDFATVDSGGGFVVKPVSGWRRGAVYISPI